MKNTPTLPAIALETTDKICSMDNCEKVELPLSIVQEMMNPGSIEAVKEDLLVTVNNMSDYEHISNVIKRAYVFQLGHELSCIMNQKKERFNLSKQRV